MRPAHLVAAVGLLAAMLGVAAAFPPSPANAESPEAAMGPASVAPAHVPPVPLLWKVSDGDNAIFLLGSFHLLKDDDYPLAVDIDEAFAEAERLVFEVTPEQLDAPDTTQRFLAAAGYAEPGERLSTVLSPRLREKLRRLLLRQGGALEPLDGYEPWFVNLSLLMGLSQSLGFSAENGLDRHLMVRASEAGKPVGGLESLQDQLDALDATPLDEQVAALTEFLDHPQEMPGTLGDLHRAWRDGDLDRLDELTRVEMLEETPETYRIINVERNDRWLPQLREMLDGSDDEDVMVVVGALHLLGPDGVVEKLAAEGYTVERICSACEPLPVNAF